MRRKPTGEWPGTATSTRVPWPRNKVRVAAATTIEAVEEIRTTKDTTEVEATTEASEVKVLEAEALEDEASAAKGTKEAAAACLRAVAKASISVSTRSMPGIMPKIHGPTKRRKKPRTTDTISGSRPRRPWRHSCLGVHMQGLVAAAALVAVTKALGGV